MTDWSVKGSLDYLASPTAIRDRAVLIADLTRHDDGVFALDESRLDEVAERVVDSIRRKYPDIDVPCHSRWRHFEIEGTDSLQRFNDATTEHSAIELARTGLDLIIPSVLVDAGAGPRWQFQTSAGPVLSRSEGLAIASIEMFLSGIFSADSSQPLRTDADALIALDLGGFADRMQCTEENPLIGVENRLLLLQQLGRIIQSKPEIFPNARLGDLADHLIADSGASISATKILSVILRLLGSMWPQRITVSGVNLGDAWWYSPPNAESESIVPFHKLSQWLTYSIAETLLNSSHTVTGLEQLTGLAEYRNGGLFIDSGVLKLKQDFIRPSYPVESRTIVEWRALTVYLLDKTAERVQSILGRELSLTSILEGGTWHVGRELAYERSPSGDSPLQIISDGTVF
ncbi:MAG: DUF1688 family protein [Gammaproteobacteria bacterium]